MLEIYCEVFWYLFSQHSYKVCHKLKIKALVSRIQKKTIIILYIKILKLNQIICWLRQQLFNKKKNFKNSKASKMEMNFYLNFFLNYLKFLYFWTSEILCALCDCDEQISQDLANLLKIWLITKIWLKRIFTQFYKYLFSIHFSNETPKTKHSKYTDIII